MWNTKSKAKTQGKSENGDDFFNLIDSGAKENT